VTYFPDLAPCEYFSFFEADKVRAIGWLDGTHSFSTGPADRDLLLRLVVLAESPWEPVMLMGYHTCELCIQPDTHMTPVVFEGRRLHVGVHNLFVPGYGVIYAAPSMILHYILAHGYRPPDEFAEAVRTCPEIMTPEYVEAMKRNGPDTLVSYFAVS
jgi:hypothetical protein